SVGIILFLSSCQIFDQKIDRNEYEVSKKNQFTNPVFEPILADPTVIRDEDTGLFYAYGTEDNWGDGKGNRLMPILRSKDLINWSYVGNVFENKPSWKNKGGLWAPDINK